MKTKLTFTQTMRDPQDGSATWSIKRGDDEIGTIEKSTAWCGDGYRADSYSVTIEPLDDDDEGADDCFDVANTWGRGNMTAREALAACKAFARAHVQAREGYKRPTVLYLEQTAGDVPRFGIAGGTIESSWQKSLDEYVKREHAAGRKATGLPWCKVTVEIDGPYAGVVSSFGGSVWPGAWPALFTIAPQRPDGDGSTRLTDLGLELFKAAIEAGDTMTIDEVTR